jgi:hypothetical protein
MAGRKGRSGRKPLPVELHIARGSFRKDRHQRLLDHATSTPASVSAPASVVEGLGSEGRALVAAHLDAYTDWDVRALAYLRQAGEQRDRQAALRAAIDAVGVSTETLALLRAERQAGAMVVAALKAIDLDDAPPAGNRQGLLKRLPARVGA